MADNELTRIEATVKAAADAVVQDAINTIRQHPQYVQIVNDLVDKAIQALMSSV